jgi:hypothetical protein
MNTLSENLPLGLNPELASGELKNWRSLVPIRPKVCIFHYMAAETSETAMTVEAGPYWWNNVVARALLRP